MRLFILWCVLLGISSCFKPINDFGMNKPHLLFHLGERSKVAVNMGMGYWSTLTNNKKSNFSPLRLKYENNQKGLYADMISHDGDSHIHQKIYDKTQKIETNAKYQMLVEGWEAEVNFQRNNSNQTSSGYAMWYFTVENTDHNLVSSFDGFSKTPILLKVIQQEEHFVLVETSKAGGFTQQIKIESEFPLKIFGFSMNISQTYDAGSALEEVKYLIELQRFKMKKRKNESKIVEWENQQLKLMKKNDWKNQNYVFLVIYSEFELNNHLYITNTSRTSFNSLHFSNMSLFLDQLHFPAQQYPQHSSFLKHILYNLYGGIAFYQGVLYTQNSLLRHQFDYSYSFTPSRLIFPRAFLWDDGFHLSIAAHYNPSITLQVITNWIRKIDLLGWIGREQIRGFEMGSLMPETKFIYQDVFQMNPPTLILPILSLIEKAQTDKLDQQTVKVLNSTLKDNFWKLEKWYRYFVRTQSHNNLMQKQYINKSSKFRWRCKDDCELGNFMGSGLDDYPRIQDKTSISKQHVDLISWIYFFSEGLQTVAKYLSLPKPERYYHKKKIEMKEKLFNECLDRDLIFKDQAVKAKNQYIDQLVSKLGYVSLFPFFLGALRSDSQNILQVRDKLVEVMMDPEKLMSQDGIRSLAKNDPDFGTLDNYWRGAVWMPINYLILRACRLYYWEDQEVRELYSTLRKRLIDTVKRNWEQTGYLFENYHNGKGNRGFPFYGWTSLIAQIITEQY